jgi:hypothetical protein
VSTPDRITLHCSCGSTLQVDAALGGRKGRCPDCDAVNEVPDPRASGLLHFADEVITDEGNAEDSWSGLSSVVEVDLARSREMEAKRAAPPAMASSGSGAGVTAPAAPARRERPAPFRGSSRRPARSGTAGRADEYWSSSYETNWRVTFFAITTLLFLVIPLGPKKEYSMRAGKIESETVGMVWTWDLMDGAAPLFTFMVAVTVACVAPAIVQMSANGLAVSITKTVGGFVCLVMLLASVEKATGPLLEGGGLLERFGLDPHMWVLAVQILALATFIVAGHIRNRLGHPRPARITQGVAGVLLSATIIYAMARVLPHLPMTSILLLLVVLSGVVTIAGGILGGLNGLGLLRRRPVTDTLPLWLVYGGTFSALLITTASPLGSAKNTGLWLWLGVFRSLLLTFAFIYLLLSGICGIIVDSAIRLREARPSRA